MKLLLTNDELHEVRGGTQVFVAELARAMIERGHEVAVYSWLCGSLADELRKDDVPVVSNPRECGFVPELIHAQHHLAAMAALCAFPGVPAVYHCHGFGPWQERPPSHPRILHYVTTSDAMVNWITTTSGCKVEDVTVLPNSIDLRRFHKVRSPGLHPRRALLFGNSFIPPDFIGKITKACVQCGMTLDLVGAQFHNATDAPQALLPDYDLVFAVGRSALESAACGCAVVLINVNGLGPMIRPQNLPSLMKLNFTLPGQMQSLTVKELVARIIKYDAGHVAATTAIVREEFRFDRACDRLEKLYRETLNKWRERPPKSAEEESMATSAYLAGLGPYIKGADERTAALRLQRNKSRERIHRLKHKMSRLEAKWDIVQKRLPGFIRRWLFRAKE